MATELELAAMAYMAYNPSDINNIPTGNWTADATGLTRSSNTGFAATVYTNPAGEIVIAFRGTDDNPESLFSPDFENANIPAAMGTYSSQVLEAIKLVADAMAAHPGVNISLTGHSLGGGLASLMSVFFDLPATVFDPAPFGDTAQSLEIGTGQSLVDSDLVQRYFNEYQKYLSQNHPYSVVSDEFQAYAKATSAGSTTKYEAYLARQSNVTGFYVQDEILSRGMSLVSTALRAASENLPTLLENMVDSSLYATSDSSSRTISFVNKLSQGQLTDGSKITNVPINPTNTCERFAWHRSSRKENHA